jgi:hypothetical protein
MGSINKLPKSQHLQKSWSGNKKSQRSTKKPKTKLSLEHHEAKVNVA